MFLPTSFISSSWNDDYFSACSALTLEFDRIHDNDPFWANVAVDMKMSYFEQWKDEFLTQYMVTWKARLIWNVM